MVETEEGGGGGGGVEIVGVGEAAVGGAVCEHGGRGREAVDLDAHEGEGGPAGDGPGDAADGDDDCGHAEGADEGREAHCAGEDEVAELPGGEEVGFVFVEGGEEGG